jgi:competence protein ComEC
VALVVLEGCYALGIIRNSPSKALLEVFNAGAVNDSSEFVLFLDVGQGDCTIIKSKTATAIIDFGVTDEDNTIYSKLLELGIDRVDLAVITHHHNDHFGGFNNLAQNIKIDNLLINSTSADDSQSEELQGVLTTANKKGVNIIKPMAGACFSLGDATLKVLYIDHTAKKENNRSIATMVYIGGKKILLTGDAEGTVERHIAKTINIDCDILKMGHHGSYTSTTKNLLNAATPSVAVASVGYDNIYNHPSDWALLRLEFAGVNLYRTDLDGDIYIKFNRSSSSFSVIRG